MSVISKCSIIKAKNHLEKRLGLYSVLTVAFSRLLGLTSGFRAPFVSPSFTGFNVTRRHRGFYKFMSWFDTRVSSEHSDIRFRELEVQRERQRSVKLDMEHIGSQSDINQFCEIKILKCDFFFPERCLFATLHV